MCIFPTMGGNTYGFNIISVRVKALPLTCGEQRHFKNRCKALHTSRNIHTLRVSATTQFVRYRDVTCVGVLIYCTVVCDIKKVVNAYTRVIHLSTVSDTHRYSTQT